MGAPEPSAIQPLGDRVLVETILEEETRTGIIIPQVSQGRPERARVLAVGPGRTTDKGLLLPMPVKVGDVILFNRHAGTHVGSFDDRYIIFREQDLLAIVVE